MNQEDDEDAFLYGDNAQSAPVEPSTKIASAPAQSVDHEMAQESEEGEVDEGEEEEEEEDSVPTTLCYLTKRILNL